MGSPVRGSTQLILDRFPSKISDSTGTNSLVSRLTAAIHALSVVRVRTLTDPSRGQANCQRIVAMAEPIEDALRWSTNSDRFPRVQTSTHGAGQLD